MVVSQVHSIDQSKERDGCLLLWFEGNVLFSLNESASVVWAEIEKYPEGVSTKELVNRLEQYYSECGVRKVRLEQDVRELIGRLLERGFLTEKGVKGSGSKYRVKNDVFGTGGNDLWQGGVHSKYDQEMTYRPDVPSEVGRWRSIADTLLGVVAIAAYEVVLRLLGFGRLCAMVESWPLDEKRAWNPVRVRQLCAGIDRARLWYPKRVRCLQHSAVATCLLRREGVPAKMVLAASRRPFRAHAWSEVRGVVVNDVPDVRTRYCVFTRCSASEHH